MFLPIFIQMYSDKPQKAKTPRLYTNAQNTKMCQNTVQYMRQ